MGLRYGIKQPGVLAALGADFLFGAGTPLAKLLSSDFRLFAALIIEYGRSHATCFARCYDGAGDALLAMERGLAGRLAATYPGSS